MKFTTLFVAVLLAGAAVCAIPKPEMLFIPSPFKSNRNASIDTIVMHHTAGKGTAKDVAAWFQNPTAEVSSHYIVDKAGVIVQPVQDNLAAWHAGKSLFDGRYGVNQFSLGIEICNKGDNIDPYTDAQYRALGQLMAYLMDKYNIPWTKVTGHKDIAIPKGRKVDPSNNFSYARMQEEVAKVLSGQVILAQAPSTVEVCINDLRGDVPLIEKIVTALKSKNILGVLQILTQASTMISKTVSDCKHITKTDILAYAYSRLTAAQKECLANVMGSIMAVSAVKTDLQNKDWNSFFTALTNLTSQLESTRSVCKAAF